MNILPIALSAGLLYFLSKKSKSKTDSTSSSVVIGSKSLGYEIKDCNLTVYNKKLALDYAYNFGFNESHKMINNKSEWGTGPLKAKLIGKCLESLESGKKLMKTESDALFIFDLLKYFYSGINQQIQEDPKPTYDNLQKFKDNITKTFGFDTSDFIVEIVKKS